MSRQKKEINIKIGVRLKELRTKNNYTQYDFAEMLGMSDENYRKIENGSVGLTVDKLLILYHELQIDPNYLILGESSHNVEIEYYLKNSTKEQTKELMQRLINYIVDAGI